MAVCFCMWQGFGQVVLLCLYFYIAQHFNLVGGIQSGSYPGARASQDLCTPMRTRPSLQIMMKVASQRLSTRAGFRPVSPILCKWFPDPKGVPCKC